MQKKLSQSHNIIRLRADTLNLVTISTLYAIRGLGAPPATTLLQ